MFNAARSAIISASGYSGLSPTIAERHNPIYGEQQFGRARDRINEIADMGVLEGD